MNKRLLRRRAEAVGHVDAGAPVLVAVGADTLNEQLDEYAALLEGSGRVALDFCEVLGQLAEPRLSLLGGEPGSKEAAIGVFLFAHEGHTQDVDVQRGGWTVYCRCARCEDIRTYEVDNEARERALGLPPWPAG